MKLSGCDPWDSGLDWTYSKLDLTVEHLLRRAPRWGTVLRPGDYYTKLHYLYYSVGPNMKFEPNRIIRIFGFAKNHESNNTKIRYLGLIRNECSNT